MSAQTGSMPPPGPMSSRLADRARFRFDLWKTQPNPIWIRELRQSARLTRTPVILTVICVLMTMLIATVGSMVASFDSPAATGAVIFQTFFSVAYFLVVLIGPAISANSIASEREGRTWEAVLLTGLPPATIARGKFLAAFTAIAMYVVMLAPVSALPFLFGGVTATEVMVAFGGLFLIALLSVAFGLAISSKMASLRAAIVVTLLLAFPLSIGAFVSFGSGLSVLAHDLWPSVPNGPPIWLPSAYARAPFNVDYLIFLVALPVLSVLLPAWFLYEVTIANLTSVTDDRSSGIKRWFLVASPLLSTVALVPMASRARNAPISIVLLGMFFVFCVFLFAGDPIGPSRRVKIQWDRLKFGRLRRFLGPGVMRSAALLLGAGLAGLGAISVVGFILNVIDSGPSSSRPTSLVLMSTYLIAFYVFIVGLGAYLRARSSSPLTTRVLLGAILFGVAVGPWVVAAIAGLITDHSGREALVVGAPSPFYVVVMMESSYGSDSELLVTTGIFMTAGWAAIGILLLMAASRRCRTIIDKHEAVLAEGDRRLAAEDAARAEPPPDAPPAET